MNGVQKLLAVLQKRGWTLAAIADEMGVTANAVQKWKAGDRYPRPDKPVLDSLERLGRRKRIPKKRRYTQERHHAAS